MLVLEQQDETGGDTHGERAHSATIGER